MHCHSVFALGVVDLDGLASTDGRQRSCVADLTAHLGVERRPGEYDLIELSLFLFYETVAENPGNRLGIVVADKLRLAGIDGHPVGSLDSCGIAGAGFLCGHLTVESLAIHCHSVLL